MSKPLILYELVPNHKGNAPYFSPATVKARLALLTKKVPFVTKEVTYGDLQSKWSGVDGPLKMEKATVPFIEFNDGTYLVDSYKIVEYLDRTYPDRTNLYLPEAELPVNVDSPEYAAAIQDMLEFRRTASGRSLFALYAPKLVQMMPPEDQAYFTSDARLGEDRCWPKILALDYDVLFKEVMEITARVASKLTTPDGFLSSATKPGIKDFIVFGGYRMLASVDAALTKKVFEEGDVAGWLKRMYEVYGGGPEGLNALRARDPK